MYLLPLEIKNNPLFFKNVPDFLISFKNDDCPGENVAQREKLKMRSKLSQQQSRGEESAQLETSAQLICSIKL